MNPDSVIEMKDLAYSYEFSKETALIIKILKDRDDPVKSYCPSLSTAQKTLHDANPVLKDLWEQYATMVKLVQEQ